MDGNLTRIVIADDNAVVRSGIRNMLKKADDLEIVGEAGDGLEALALVTRLHPDVLLLDMEMPRMNGREVTARLRQDASPVHILVLSTYDDPQYILSTLSSGVAGYIVKEEAPDTLIKAVRGIAQGQIGWISQRLSSRLSN